MISAIIRKTSQEEQQNQTTMTTNINDTQNFRWLVKKNILKRSKQSHRTLNLLKHLLELLHI